MLLVQAHMHDSLVPNNVTIRQLESCSGTVEKTFYPDFPFNRGFKTPSVHNHVSSFQNAKYKTY